MKLSISLGGDWITSDGKLLVKLISFNFNSPDFLVTKAIENSLRYLEKYFPITPLMCSLTLG